MVCKLSLRTLLTILFTLLLLVHIVVAREQDDEDDEDEEMDIEEFLEAERNQSAFYVAERCALYHNCGDNMECLARCAGVPAPNREMVTRTNECVAGCYSAQQDQQQQPPSTISQCVQNCIQTNFLYTPYEDAAVTPTTTITTIPTNGMLITVTAANGVVTTTRVMTNTTSTGSYSTTSGMGWIWLGTLLFASLTSLLMVVF
ncbi:uncharacterized protein VTP21DRAFT_5500 [Calcarisporiella thermophila]|uniref:uncharacterized protein n=1 Tax=Calcarisporiella thermophila TaxID=911321 RepID=UPI003742724C